MCEFSSHLHLGRRYTRPYFCVCVFLFFPFPLTQRRSVTFLKNTFIKNTQSNMAETLRQTLYSALMACCVDCVCCVCVSLCCCCVCAENLLTKNTRFHNILKIFPPILSNQVHFDSDSISAEGGMIRDILLLFE